MRELRVYVRSLTQPLTPSQRDWLAAWILVRDRFGHEHGLSDCIGPCIPEGPIRQPAVGVSALQQASMPRERLRCVLGMLSSLEVKVLRST